MNHLPVLLPLPAAHLNEFWPSVRDLVLEACEGSGGRFMVSDVLNMLLAQRMQLWVAMEDYQVLAIGITQIMTYPQLKECQFLAATGRDMDLWVPLIEKIEEYATMLGCRKIVPICRPGWQKPLKKYGYALTHVQLEKDLGYVH